MVGGRCWYWCTYNPAPGGWCRCGPLHEPSVGYPGSSVCTCLQMSMFICGVCVWMSCTTEPSVWCGVGGSVGGVVKVITASGLVIVPAWPSIDVGSRLGRQPVLVGGSTQGDIACLRLCVGAGLTASVPPARAPTCGQSLCMISWLLGFASGMSEAPVASCLAGKVLKLVGPASGQKVVCWKKAGPHMQAGTALPRPIPGLC